jgi:hypothetical protein
MAKKKVDINDYYYQKHVYHVNIRSALKALIYNVLWRLGESKFVSYKEKQINYQ